jgi:hypothetical protein
MMRTLARPKKKQSKANCLPSDEARQVVEDYANDLRAIIKKLLN